MTDIYLDNAATTFPKPECVYTTMDVVNRTLSVNAGRGLYAAARKAADLIERARNLLLSLIHADKMAEVVFTASATVAFNEIIGGIQWNSSDIVYVSPYEHNALMRPLYLAKEKYHFQLIELALKQDTYEIDLEKNEYLFHRNPPTHLLISQVSNVTGYILPVEELFSLCKEYKPWVIIDGSQAMGLVSFDYQKTPVDFYVFAGHKTLYGPLGVGGFIQKKGRKLKPYLAGGTGSDSLNLHMSQDQKGLEPGSPNIVAIAGLEAALCQRQEEKELLQQERFLVQILVEKLSKEKKIILYLPQEEKRTGIFTFAVKGSLSSDIGYLLDEDYGIGVRAGYHCAPLIHKYLQDEDTLGVIRVSVGCFTTMEEMNRFVQAIEEILESY